MFSRLNFQETESVTANLRAAVGFLKIPANSGRVLLGLFRNINTRNRRYLCSFGSYSVLGMNEMSFCSFCSR